LASLENCSIILSGNTVLNDATFALRNGERWALIGPNGSGKTLLLKLLRGDMWPTPNGKEAREYFFDGEASAQPFAAKEHIAYVGPERQDKYVRYEWNHTVTQVVTTGLFDEEIPRTQATTRQSRRVARLLKQFGLWSLRRRGFLTLSYGQRRRALVARAFAGQPQVLLLDEVFNGLDAASRKILHKALKRTRGTGSTWIVTTHRAHDVPANVTHVAKMKEGRIVVLSVVEKRADILPRTAARQRLDSVIPAYCELLPHSQHDLRPWRPQAGIQELKMDSRLRGNDARNPPPLIELRNVDLYRDYRLVLHDVNWTIARGEHWGIVGSNGSGKSTLLKLLYGDLHPHLGGVIERGKVPFGTPIAEWKQRVGYVSPELQADYFSARDLEEVVMSGRYSSIGLNNLPTLADRRAAKRWLKFFGLETHAARRPRAVSYGQMRLALLARAMINHPELLLLDEPCTGLDPQVRAMVIALLARLAKQGVQLVMAVHERSDLPSCVGRVLEIGKNRTVKAKRRDG
jgi:molybdate transport system ATP-binding protein